jgi:hypothetical protein
LLTTNLGAEQVFFLAFTPFILVTRFANAAGTFNNVVHASQVNRTTNELLLHYHPLANHGFKSWGRRYLGLYICAKCMMRNWHDLYAIEVHASLFGGKQSSRASFTVVPVRSQNRWQVKTLSLLTVSSHTTSEVPKSENAERNCSFARANSRAFALPLP